MIVSRLLRTTLLAIALVMAASGPAMAEPGGEHRYDEFFRKYSKRFFGIGFDWRLFKAQGITESNLRPGSESRRGARGVMQLLPSTYRQVQMKNPELGDIGHPEWNIAAGIWYARQLWNAWRDDTAQPHHRSFMLASYNAGRATLLRAQRVAESRHLDPRLWPSIEQIAPTVPRWAYRETLDYVVRVLTTLQLMDHRGRLTTP
jgi:membrane-bound lytic murein transglycosylase F